MIWQDIIVQRGASSDEVRAAVASALEVGLARVAIVESFTTFVRRPTLEAAAEVFPRRGSFSMQVSIYAYGPPPRDEQAALMRFARAIASPCLASDDSDSPYQMLLFRPGARPEPVTLDPEALDARGEYVLL